MIAASVGGSESGFGGLDAEKPEELGRRYAVGLAGPISERNVPVSLARHRLLSEVRLLSVNSAAQLKRGRLSPRQGRSAVPARLFRSPAH